MARRKRIGTGKSGASDMPADSPPAEPAGRRGTLPLPSPITGTNLVIADVVLRAAGGMLRQRMEKGLVTRSYGTDNSGRAKAEKMVEGRGMVATLALWGASRLARRSPLGLAVVVGGLAAKVFYDRGRQIESERRTRKASKRES